MAILWSRAFAIQAAIMCFPVLLRAVVGSRSLDRERSENSFATENVVAGLAALKDSTGGVDYKEIVSAVVIFGDSTVDVGNNNYLATIVKSNFEPYGRQFESGASGRFCDGKIVPDYITERLGYPLTLPYLAPNAHGDAILTGINFASSASGWYDATASNFNVKGLTTQFEWYKNWKSEVISLAGPEKGSTIISKAFYIISTGSNDWVNNYYLNPVLSKKYTPDSYTAFLIGLAASYIKELYEMGGRNVAVLNLPPLGCLPSQITLHGKGKPGCVAELNDVAEKFNRELMALVDGLQPTFEGGHLLYCDEYTLLSKMVQTPGQYGFRETRAGCCGTGVLETAILCNKESIGTCQDAYPFVWWDSFHPTTHAYSLIAADLWNQVVPKFGVPPQP